ncbi:MAG: putative toxin-antitoxin system toxin component, PIN family [Pirellulales bacterium]|nr:putative toxin-antitoxin system toxin component, PIN family [Pirellulales bacterium]
MKIVVDTNVLISGIFFTGPPFQILDAWRQGVLKIVVSPDILDEYQRVGVELSDRFPAIDLQPVLDLLTITSIVVDPFPLPEQVCSDSDDDKFLACAIAGKVKRIVSGDKALLETSGYADILVMTPRDFVERYLKRRK